MLFVMWYLLQERLVASRKEEIENELSNMNKERQVSLMNLHNQQIQSLRPIQSPS